MSKITGAMPQKSGCKSQTSSATIIQRFEQSLKAFFPNGTFVKGAKIQQYPVWQEEAHCVSNAVSKRQNEFYTGRWLASQGLKQLSHLQFPVMVGNLKQPLWPENILGSITHDGELCFVVIVEAKLNQHCQQHQQNRQQGVGIDLMHLNERTAHMDELSSMFVTQKEELDFLVPLANQFSLSPELLLFSFKESILKGLNFYLDRFIDLKEIQLLTVNSEVSLISIFGEEFPIYLQGEKVDDYLMTACHLEVINV